MWKDRLGMKGHVTIELRDRLGVLKEVREANLILTDGLEIAADLLGGLGGQTKLQAIAIGDNGTAPSVSDTDIIGTELGRQTTSNSQPSSGLARFVSTFAAGVATGTWREASIADTNAAKGARKCAARVAFGDITKGAGDSMTVTWDITFS